MNRALEYTLNKMETMTNGKEYKGCENTFV